MLDYRQLKHLRLLHGLTQTNIANELKITRNFISMMENDSRKYSQEWHDNYVKTIYILYTRKNTHVDVIEDIKEITKELETPIVEPVKEIELENVETVIVEEVIEIVKKKKAIPLKKTK